VKSQMTRANQTALPFTHYKEMEKLARLLGDNTLLTVALTYAGDMLQRGGKVEGAIAYLEEAQAITDPVDISARGNAIQLLGRAYFKAKRFSDFERAMKESEEIAYAPAVVGSETSVKGQFNAGTVYEEYARSLGLLGQLNTAMDYIDKAEKAFEKAWSNQRRDVLMSTAKAMVLVHGGEIRAGVEVAVEATELCKQAGNIRLLDRMYGLQRYLDNLSREIGNTGAILRTALDGPLEY
ncbi:MAG: hypothetical protein ACRDHW_06615, partial [Ktedonobacteraceae bacterium]